MKYFTIPTISILLFCTFFYTESIAQTKWKSLNHLYSIKGKRTVTGHHNREPNWDPSKQTRRINEVTGEYPGLWGGDFLFSSEDIQYRWKMTEQAIIEWNNGAIVSLMWHACNPAKSQPCGFDGNGVRSKLSSWEWEQLLRNGTPINTKWKEMMDEVAFYLQRLEDNGVEVFFRPLHEINNNFSWWGGVKRNNRSKRLYRLTQNYFKNVKGLSNLIFVFDVDDSNYDWWSYNPGGRYWDVFAVDMYNKGYTTRTYNKAKNFAGSKPMGIGEFEFIPSPQVIASQPNWTFFMGWAELVFERNSTRQIQDTYFSYRTTTLRDMPGWRNSRKESLYQEKNTLLNNQLSVVPNPSVDGFFSIKFPKKGNYELLISDMLGKVIKTVDITQGTEPIEIELNKKPGIYTLTAMGFSQMYTKKLVIK
ncbi:glycosyl hydrolase [Aquimarina sp. RZ0]|uniref:glycosyl hydrolase n=1 Tax=Aquimarina sp. RZ0 TaxID=2607730 RepID=UPI0011F1EDAA|nr:glycosyl hydrolase [Aquimarina sp. RZ0]KAA1246619.1 T9SS type A sorting domain-containing protein [Aquimarina sp. RZ0]